MKCSVKEINVVHYNTIQAQWLSTLLWLDLLSQTNQVCGFGLSFFRLSYFDRTDLQLFAIFMAKKLVGPRCVQIVSKRLVSQISCSIVKCLVY